MTGWLDRLAGRCERFAVPGLVRVIVGFNALVFVLYKLKPGFVDLLTLDRAAVLRGEVWRLASYIFIPQFGGVIFPDWLVALIYLAFLLFIGDGLEAAWGAARVNLYWLFGMAGTTVAALVFGADFANFMLGTALFLAFAKLYPDTVIYFMFILPVRVKWLAWLTGASLLFGFVGGSWAYRGAVAAALANYLLFFGPETVRTARGAAEATRRRQQFERDRGAAEAFHRCAVCGRTEGDGPELEFRVGADGQEYCGDHRPGRAGKAG